MDERQYIPKKIEKAALEEIFFTKCSSGGEMSLCNFLLFVFEKNMISN
jgi:hypothetical protein